jgi:uncharacterized protein YjiS (DUF1127 family)
MSVFVSTTPRPAIRERPGAFSRLLNVSYDGIAGYFVARAAIARLREFDDPALRDIGLARSEIEPAVRGLITLPGRARKG